MLNSIVLIGRLVRDPELRYTNNGKPFTHFTLAVDRNYKNSQGERETDFISIFTWGKQAESSAQYLKKGRLTAIKGKLQIRKNKQDNRTYINPEIVADQVQFLEWGKNEGNGKGSPKNTDSGDNREESYRESGSEFF